MFTVTVVEVPADAAIDDKYASIERYRQTVDDLDLPKLIAVINAKKRGPRPAKKGEKAS